MPLVQTFPVANTVYDYWIDDDEEFQPWSEMVPEYEFDIKMPFFNILVPTEMTKFKRYLSSRHQQHQLQVHRQYGCR